MVSHDVTIKLTGKSPIDFNNYLIDHEVIASFVIKTSGLAFQNIKPMPKIKPWSGTRTVEIRKFIKIIL